MGFLKKIFKPVSKVLDKIIPNEIKPALPYLAAFAPVFGPTAGMFGSTMGKRMLLSGGANILGQLSQEGNEGDINLLSAGLGALSGAMTTPGAADTFQGMKTYGGRTIADIGEGTIAGQATGLEKLKNLGLEGLSKGSNILRPGGEIPDLFSKAGAKAATLPATTATGDVMQAEARRLEKQSIIDAALDEAAGLGDSAASALAIRKAMEAYGFFSEEEIEDTITSAGYKAGGRVGFFAGGSGIPSLPIADQTREMEPEEFEGTVSELLMLENIDKPIIKKSYSKEDSGRRNEAFFEIIDPETGSMSTISQEDYFEQYGEPKAKGGRVGFRFGGIDEAVESVQEETVEKGKEGIMTAAKEDPMLVEEYNKYVFDLMEQRPNAKPMSFQDFKRMIMSGMKDGGIMATEIPLKDSVKNINKKGQPDTTMVKMKEGGLMNLGGKEMDLRGGGFVPIGKKEKADDVPARLSKNEFVMTADAVRAAGGGSVNEGAKRMYDVMNKLEARA
jgi:hypothetical protein